MNSSQQNVRYVHGRTVDPMGDKRIENVISATQVFMMYAESDYHSLVQKHSRFLCLSRTELIPSSSIGHQRSIPYSTYSLSILLLVATSPCNPAFMTALLFFEPP